MKKKLLIISGAGSSMACGMPSVGELDADMERWSDNWSYQRGFSNYYRALRGSMQEYLDKSWMAQKPMLNFESSKILREIIALSHWMTPAPLGDPLAQIWCVMLHRKMRSFRSELMSFDPSGINSRGTVSIPGAVDRRKFVRTPARAPRFVGLTS